MVSSERVATLGVFAAVILVTGFTVTPPDSSLFLERNLAKQQGLSFHFIHANSVEFFSDRALASLESVFFHHPDAHVTLHVRDSNVSTAVESLINSRYDITVKEYNLNYDILSLINSPLSEFNQAQVSAFIEKIEEYSTNQFWATHQSDLLRLLLLYKEGGIYLDTDNIVVRPLDALRNNVGQEFSTKPDEFIIANGVLAFDRGNRFLADCLKAFFRDFELGMDKWGFNGPRLITRVYLEGDYSEEDVTVLPVSAFYNLKWQDVVETCMKSRPDSEAILESLLNDAFVLHTCNHLTANVPLEPGSVCHRLFKMFCLDECSVA